MTPISRTLATELHAPELVDLRLELLDNEVPLGKQRPGLGQHRLQGIDVVRKRRRIRHAREFTHLPRGLQHRQWRAPSGRLLPVDAFEKHRQLGLRQMDLAAVGLRPDKVSALEPLAEYAEPVSHSPENLFRGGRVSSLMQKAAVAMLVAVIVSNPPNC
jgi:hypothetical protein